MNAASPRPGPAAPVVALLAALALAGLGCGLFDTAQPEPPTGGTSVPPDFTEPESTLATLARAVHGREAGNYGLCYADTLLEQRGFHAAFDPADIQAFIQSGRTPPSDWRREDELTFFPQFVTFQPNAFYDVYFLPDPTRPDLNLSATRRILNRLYRVWAAGAPVAAGAAGLQIERVGLAGEWKLTYWEDRRDTADVRTWGTARLNGR